MTNIIPVANLYQAITGGGLLTEPAMQLPKTLRHMGTQRLGITLYLTVLIGEAMGMVFKERPFKNAFNNRHETRGKRNQLFS